MYSLDIISLFTNVPLEFVLEGLTTLTNDRTFTPPLPIDKFCDLIRLCVKSTVFEFEGNFYAQKAGVSMGSPLSPVLANLCMEFFEKRFLRDIPLNIKHELWVRYVDDIFIIYKHGEEAFESFLYELNNKIDSIKFTFEKEVERQLSFLDTCVHRDTHNNSFKFSVYRKQTHTNSYIHFFSFHERKVKTNVLTNLFFRAYRICDPIFVDKEIDFLVDSFSKLCYPKYFITCCLRKARKMYFTPIEKDPPNFKMTLCLPYNPHLEPLTKHIDRNKPGYNISFHYHNTLRSRLVKNNLSNHRSSAGVYAIPCNDCNKCYIGESGRGLQTRKKEHIAACKSGNSYNAIAKHTWDLDHRIDFQGASLIYKCQERNIRRVVEGALISLNNTFENNKGLTKDDNHVNEIICQVANISNYNNISARLSSAASLSLPAQVPADDSPIGRDQAPTQLRPVQQLPTNFQPSNQESPEDHRNIPPRRSLRLQQRNNT